MSILESTSASVSRTASADTGTCGYCGTWPSHGLSSCPAVKSVEFYPNGMVKKVEKFSLEERAVHLGGDAYPT